MFEPFREKATFTLELLSNLIQLTINHSHHVRIYSKILKFQVTSSKEQKGESLHGEALHKIANLEKKKQSGFSLEEDTIAAPPNFVVGLQGKNTLVEGKNFDLWCPFMPKACNFSLH